ncbi:MAG: Gfo/Idh/MocA family protein [Anaerolineales bacterium]
MSETGLRLGVVGCGNVTVERHIPAVNRLDGARVVAVADPVDARVAAGRAVAELPESQAFSSFSAMADACELDYVLVAVPPSVRGAIVEDAFERGLDVLSEKPLATSPLEAAKMIERARSLGRKFGVVHNYLFFPEYRLVRELVDQGEVGALRHIATNFLGVPDAPGNDEYRPRWRHDLDEAGGGVLMDMIHVFYLAEYLMGDQIAGVSAVVDNLGLPNDQVEDFVLAHLYFPEGYVSINLSWSEGPGGLEVTGSSGRILAFYEDFKTGPFSTFEDLTLVNETGKKVYRPRRGQEVIDDTFDALHLDFFEAVRDDRDPVATAEDGARTLQAALATYSSGMLGRRVPLPLRVDDPVYQEGVVGLRQIPPHEFDPLRGKPLFGMQPVGDTTL